jgi:hypothetical protein
MYIQFYVEEPSAEAFLQSFLPKVLGQRVEYDIQVFQGKTDLLSNLPMRLRALATWIPDDWRVMVLVDRDDDDCIQLKEQLNQCSRQAGLSLREPQIADRPIQLLNRIAVEELEAWLFGDVPALCKVYPRLSKDLARRERYRVTDAIPGGTWEALERELQRVGYHHGGLPKIQVARAVAAHMDPIRNRSASFHAFYRGLKELAEIVDA